MPAALIESIANLRDHLSGARRAGATIGLVPTMGALHVGHARLIEQARRECQLVVVSIFINPTQFDRADDLARYPRTLAADHRLCDRLGVDVVFAPSVEEMYPSKPQCTVAVGPIADHLCGRYRPGHFQGVAAIVLKLLQIVQPALIGLIAISSALIAGAIIATGSCASWGGIPSAEPNPTGAAGAHSVLPGKTIVNLPGCPAKYDLGGL
jgi:pantoate--beta-alanine ligase